MYGDNVVYTKKFGFTTGSTTADEDFDKAVKEINKIYHENGHFKTKQEVLEHFRKYGFSEIYL
jgi:hypothetical protein